MLNGVTTSSLHFTSTILPHLPSLKISFNDYAFERRLHRWFTKHWLFFIHPLSECVYMLQLTSRNFVYREILVNV